MNLLQVPYRSSLQMSWEKTCREAILVVPRFVSHYVEWCLVCLHPPSHEHCEEIPLSPWGRYPPGHVYTPVNHTHTLDEDHSLHAYLAYWFHREKGSG